MDSFMSSAPQLWATCNLREKWHPSDWNHSWLEFLFLWLRGNNWLRRGGISENPRAVMWLVLTDTRSQTESGPPFPLSFLLWLYSVLASDKLLWQKPQQHLAPSFTACSFCPQVLRSWRTVPLPWPRSDSIPTSISFGQRIEIFKELDGFQRNHLGGESAGEALRRPGAGGILGT